MRLAPIPTLIAAVALLAGCNQTAAPPTAATVAAGPAATAGSQPVVLKPMPFTMPVWSVGDQWLYSDGYGMRVTEINGEDTRFQRIDDNSQWFVSRGIFRERSQSRTALRSVVFRSDDPNAIYSATVGRPVVFFREYTRNGVLVRHSTSWAVEGYERIGVPAGTFDTIVLVMRTRSMTGNWTGYERWWYSPQVRNYVRLEFKYGEAPESARVLVSYAAKPPAS